VTVDVDVVSFLKELWNTDKKKLLVRFSRKKQVEN
jgi:hypothetical protein